MPKTIGIIDADLLDNGTRHPNLALMKISGYQKELGNDVTLLEDYYSIPKYDEVYLSRVFDFTNVPIDPKNYPNLHIGGTGFFWMTAPDLPGGRTPYARLPPLRRICGQADRPGHQAPDLQ